MKEKKIHLKNFSPFTFHFSLQKGETLIEALGALAIVAIVASAVASVVISAVSNANNNENKTLSTKFAQQGLETVHQIRDRDYTTFKTTNGLYCLAKGQTALGTPQASCPTPNVDTFIRSVLIEQVPGCATNVARVTVTVAWNDGKCQTGIYCNKQMHTSCLSTINPVPVP